MARAFSVRPIPSAASRQLDRTLTQAIAELQSGAPLRRPGEGQMTTLADMAARVRQVRQRHDERAEALVTKAAEITKRGEQAIGQMEKIVAEQDADVAALENELRLTNGGPA